MKNALLYFALIFAMLSTKGLLGQQRIVIENDAYMVFENNTFLVIDNKNTNAITTINGGNIITEEETRRVKWNTLDGVGNYTVPFTTQSFVKIPLLTQVTTAGAGTQGAVIFSTFATQNDDNTSYPAGLTNMQGPCDPNIGLHVVDRFWLIDAATYATKPAVKIDFTYNNDASEIGGTNVINEQALKAQRFNIALGSWQTPAALFGTADQTNSLVQNAVVSPANFHRIWTLVDTTLFKVHINDTVKICSGSSVFLGGAYQTQSGDFIDTVYSVNACDSIFHTNLIVVPTPDPTITSTATFCITNTAVFLTAIDPGGVWSGTGIINAQAGLFNPLEAGIGTHTINYAIGGFCPKSASTQITVVPLEVPVLTGIGPFCLYNEGGFLTASIPGGIWSGLGIVDPNTGEFDPQTAGSGLHTITYTLTGFCQGDSSIKVNVRNFNDIACVEIDCGEVFIPNGFSPNGNAINDCLFVFGDCITSVNLSIYSRWGELLFQGNRKDDCWDGTYKGEPLNSGVYVYNLETRDVRGEVVKKSGNITLFR